MFIYTYRYMITYSLKIYKENLKRRVN